MSLGSLLPFLLQSHGLSGQALSEVADMRVLVAMSGGVDSSVAAARMVDAGHEVTGVHLALAPKQHSGRGCCTLDDARDARRVADALEIPYYVWDFSAEFQERVVQDFLSEYEHGRTPNPCLRCNEHIKFAALLNKARALGFDRVATGHYAQLHEHGSEVSLHRAVDPSKDQSYVLAVLDQEQLRASLFPLGGDTKEVVREEARVRGLLVAQKPDSHDICFIPDGDTARFVTDRIGVRPGALVDAQSGAVVGAHSGTAAFTIGQRRGLGLPNAEGQPRYVVGIDAPTATVQVGPAELLDARHIVGGEVIWTQQPIGQKPVPVVAQMRAHGEPIPAAARFDGQQLVVDLDHPIRGLAAGQQVVIYDGDRVLGSARVQSTDRIS
jgi:tRNA-specific 2-thiouridylase